jgi:hypothetical protein
MSTMTAATSMMTAMMMMVMVATAPVRSPGDAVLVVAMGECETPS